MFELVVTAPFEHNGDSYVRGRRVTDPAAVAELLQCQPHSVVKVSAPVASPPKKAKA